MSEIWELYRKPFGSVWRYVVRNKHGECMSCGDSIRVAVLSALNLAKLAGLAVDIVDGGEEPSDA